MRRKPRANRNFTFGPSTKRQSTNVTISGRGSWLSHERQFEIECGEWLTHDLKDTINYSKYSIDIEFNA